MFGWRKATKDSNESQHTTNNFAEKLSSYSGLDGVIVNVSVYNSFASFTQTVSGAETQLNTFVGVIKKLLLLKIILQRFEPCWPLKKRSFVKHTFYSTI